MGMGGPLMATAAAAVAASTAAAAAAAAVAATAAAAVAVAVAARLGALARWLTCSGGGNSKDHGEDAISSVMPSRFITRPIAATKAICWVGPMVCMSVTRVSTQPASPASSPGATTGMPGLCEIQLPGATCAAPIPTCGQA
jgi:hypothetical protein